MREKRQFLLEWMSFVLWFALKCFGTWVCAFVCACTCVCICASCACGVCEMGLQVKKPFDGKVQVYVIIIIRGLSSSCHKQIVAVQIEWHGLTWCQCVVVLTCSGFLMRLIYADKQYLKSYSLSKTKASLFLPWYLRQMKRERQKAT